jgi:predicted RNA-binding Zn ribbon-like protein
VVTRKRGTDLTLVGGDPALDFANTIDGPPDDWSAETLHDYGDLVDWAVHAGVLDAGTARALSRAAGRAPGEAGRALERARAARAAIYVSFRAIAGGDEPPAGALDDLRAGDARALESAALGREAAPSPGAAARFTFEWEHDGLDRILWPLSVAAVDLLRTGPLDRLKMCAVCRWLFIDASRNRSRRWCSMNECGGRLKMQRYRARRATEGR